MKKKIVKNYVYEGLGFPINLSNVQMEEIMGQWTPVIDVEKISKETMLALAKQETRLTGNQIKFIRHYFAMSLRTFAQQVVSQSHTAVAKWEKFGDEITNMDINIEKIIRLYICDELTDSCNFHACYHIVSRQNFTSKNPNAKLYI